MCLGEILQPFGKNLNVPTPVQGGSIHPRGFKQTLGIVGVRDSTFCGISCIHCILFIGFKHIQAISSTCDVVSIRLICLGGDPQMLG